MSVTFSQLLCDVGRPCPNFQRLIEYVEPGEEKYKVAAGDSLLRGPDPCRRTWPFSASTIRWNPRTSRLRINPYTLRNPRLPNYPQSESSKKNEAGAQQRKQEEPKDLQAKPIVKIKPNSSKTNPSVIVPQFDVEIRALMTQYAVSGSKMNRKLQQLSLGPQNL